MDLFPPRRRANRLTDLDEVTHTVMKSSFAHDFVIPVFVNDMVSMTIRSIDMNIHVYVKLAGH